MLINPIHPARDDFRAGIIAAQLAEMRGGKHHGEPVLASDMLPTPLQVILTESVDPADVMAEINAKVKAGIAAGFDRGAN